jgi:hypothetical protein
MIGIDLTAAVGLVSAAVTTVLTVAVVTAAEFLTRLLTAAKPINQGAELQLKLDPSQPRQIVSGRTATGGSLVYAFTWTDDSSAPNKYLVRVIALSDFPITNVYQVFDGTEYLTFGSGSNADYYTQSTPPTSPRTGDYWQNTESVPYQWTVWNGSEWVATGSQTPAITNQAIYSSMAPCDQYQSKKNETRFWCRIYKGVLSGAVADPYLMENSPSNEWTSQHVGTGMAYAITVAQYDTDAFPEGEPELQFVIDGAPCFDDRYAPARGGTGNQVETDPTTWTFSTNAAVQAAQLLRGYRINGVTICGSSADDQDLDPNMCMAAFNTCDELVEVPDALGGGYEAQYQAGMMLTSTNTVQQDLIEFQNAFDGQIYDRGGVITLLPGGTRTPIMALDDTDVVWAGPSSWQPDATLSDLYNCVIGSYVPASQNYVSAAYPIQKDLTYITQDGGERINLEVDFRAVTSDSQIQRLTARRLASSRYQGTAAFVCPLWALVIEQGDWITISSDRWNFYNLYFTADQISVTADMKLAFVCKQTSPVVTDWIAAVDYIPSGLTISTRTGYSLPIPVLTLEPVQQTSDDTYASIPAIQYTCSVPTGSTAIGFDLNLRVYGDDLLVWQLPSLLAGEVTGIYNNALVPSQTYEMQARSNDGYRTSDWSDWVDVTIPSIWASTDSGALGGVPYNEVNAAIAAAAAASAAFTALATAADTDLDTYIAAVTTAALTASSTFAAIVADVEALANAQMSQALTTYNQNALNIANSYVAGQPVGPLVEALAVSNANVVENQTLMGIKNTAGNAWVMNDYTTQYASTGQFVAATTSTIQANIAGNASAITTEATVRASADSSQAAQITTLQTNVASNTSTITANYTTLSTAQATTAASLLALQSTVSTNMATVTANYVTNASLTSTLAGVETTIQTNYQAYTQAAIYTSAFTTSGATTGSLASYVVALNTSLGGLSGTVSSNYTSLTNSISSTNTSLSTLQSSYNGTAATVTTQGATVANITGQLYANYVLKANSNGNIASMELITASGPTTISGVIFEANYFTIRSSTYTAITPFFYDAVSGTLFLQNVTANTANIANAAINTLKLGGAAVTNGAGVTGTTVNAAAGSTSTLISESLSLDTVTPGQVTGTFSVYLNPYTGGTLGTGVTQKTLVTATVTRDGSTIYSTIIGVAILIASSPTVSLMAGGMVCFSFVDPSPTGTTHTYAVTVSVDSSVTGGANFNTPNLDLLEIKR